MSILTAGFDLGGTKLLGVVADEDGRVMAEGRRPTRLGPEAVLEDVEGLLGELRAAVPAVAAVGVGAAGMVDLDGVMRYAPNLPGWEDVSIRARLEAALVLPVAVDNDANVAARGELHAGAARGCSEVLLITLGTGVGGAAVTGGRIHRGAGGFAAEVGHITVDLAPDAPVCPCGGTGHWEVFASGTALGRLGREWAAGGRAPLVLHRAGGQVASVTGFHVGESAQAGEPDGLALLDLYASRVAVGLGSLVNVLDPEIVVVAGGLVQLGETLLGRVRAGLEAFVEASGRRRLPAVVAATLGERAGAVGAALLARHEALPA